MVKQKIFNWFILVSVMTTGLSSQLLSKEKPRNLFWGLIKIDNEDKDEDIHWFDKWFRTREFAAPITYMPVEIRYGLGFRDHEESDTDFSFGFIMVQRWFC